MAAIHMLLAESISAEQRIQNPEQMPQPQPQLVQHGKNSHSDHVSAFQRGVTAKKGYPPLRCIIPAPINVE